MTDFFFDLFCGNIELCLPLCLRGSCIVKDFGGLSLPRLVTMRCSLLPLPGTFWATTSVFALRLRTCSTDGICRPRKVNATVMMMHLALLKVMNMMHLTAKRTRLCRQKYMLIVAGITPGVCALASLARLSSASSTGRTEAWLQALGFVRSGSVSDATLLFIECFFSPFCENVCFHAVLYGTVQILNTWPF